MPTSATRLPLEPVRGYRRVFHAVPRPIELSGGALNLLIGVPGAGKTTYCGQAIKAGQLGVRVSLDDARAQLGAGAYDQTVTPQAVAYVADQVDQLLSQHKEVTVDATSSTAAERATWVTLAKKHGVPAIAHWLTTSTADAMRHNAPRTHPVPGTVIAEMGHRLGMLTVNALYGEGIAAVIEVRSTHLHRAHRITSPLQPGRHR